MTDLENFGSKLACFLDFDRKLAVFGKFWQKKTNFEYFGNKLTDVGNFSRKCMLEIWREIGGFLGFFGIKLTDF